MLSGLIFNLPFLKFSNLKDYIIYIKLGGQILQSQSWMFKNLIKYDWKLLCKKYWCDTITLNCVCSSRCRITCSSYLRFYIQILCFDVRSPWSYNFNLNDWFFLLWAGKLKQCQLRGCTCHRKYFFPWINNKRSWYINPTFM